MIQFSVPFGNPKRQAQTVCLWQIREVFVQCACVSICSHGVGFCPNIYTTGIISHCLPSKFPHKMGTTTPHSGCIDTRTLRANDIVRIDLFRVNHSVPKRTTVYDVVKSTVKSSVPREPLDLSLCYSAHPNLDVLDVTVPKHLIL